MNDVSSASKPTVGVVGLGSMGLGIGLSLLKEGRATYGFDLDQQRTEQFQVAGGRVDTLSSVVGKLDIIVLVVVNAEQVKSILFGASGIAVDMKLGALIIACPTMDATDAEEIEARLNEIGLLYLDAPISGGSIKANEGALTVMASGADEAFAAAEPFLSACAERVFNLGNRAGPGSAMKMVNQHLAGVHIAVAAEAIVFGIAQGIPAQKALEVISSCAGTSWMFENRVPHIVAGDYSPHSAVNIFVKDLGIVTSAANALGVKTDLAQAALQRFNSAKQSGLGQEDDAAVVKTFATDAGITLPGES
jgi:L-threonate 2-dehydrogenase